MSNTFTDSMNEATGAAMVEFKSFFPSRTLPKGLPLELYYNAKDRSILFQLRVRLHALSPSRSRTILEARRVSD